MTDAYRTLAGSGRDSFEVRGSEFIGYAGPANTVAAAEAFIQEVRERHADATHNVPWYRVRVTGGGPGGGHLLREYQSDDGEPTGSAGKPALNVVQQRDIENVVGVVTRYYGGTNLGVGGLARAYSTAVKDAVDAAGVVTQRPQARLVVTVAYDDSGTVRGILESAECSFDADYEADVTFEVTVAVADADALRERIADATSGRAEIA
ncbi:MULTISPECIES: YigZ family protein [Halobacterium]|uniref:IMPACT family protein n=1 Tax=Halobacterium TaxID=2239 RepID=UPI001963ED8D|nr:MULTISPECIES: YigZ family protein [Halobacterium]MCF2207217.1 IMPACT family protein [Halobacterium salinarum]MDL0123051.1 IMPACT family protein [Halobacterium salinarum]QRY24537.1 IMPACT family protein [Halobacterium sp. BOL4-2]